MFYLRISFFLRLILKVFFFPTINLADLLNVIPIKFPLKSSINCGRMLLKMIVCVCTCVCIRVHLFFLASKTVIFIQVCVCMYSSK